MRRPMLSLYPMGGLDDLLQPLERGPLWERNQIPRRSTSSSPKVCCSTAVLECMACPVPNLVYRGICRVGSRALMKQFKKLTVMSLFDCGTRVYRFLRTMLFSIARETILNYQRPFPC